MPEEYGDVCIECKHCFYTGLPGAYACDRVYPGFIEPFDTCEEFEKKEQTND